LGRTMEVFYDGKTKRTIRTGDRMTIQFKDAITGDADGSVNPGGNFIVGRMEGKGRASAKVAAFFFKLLDDAGIDTHFRGLRSDTEIEVMPAMRIPLEVIYRARAYGSFIARYRGRVEQMAPLDLVEFTLKDDALGDPLITPKAIVKLRIAGEAELQQMEATANKVASIISKALAERGLELIDLKLEFGRVGGELIVIDELSCDTMRVLDPAQERLMNQLELARKLGLT